MAGPLNWSSKALEDIDAIAEFIARDSPRHARRIIEALFELGDVIEVHPFAGRVVPEVGRESLRERFLYSYRVPGVYGDSPGSAALASSSLPSSTKPQIR